MGRFSKEVIFTERLKESRFSIQGLEIKGTSSKWNDPFSELKYIPVLDKTSSKIQAICFCIIFGISTIDPGKKKYSKSYRKGVILNKSHLLL